MKKMLSLIVLASIAIVPFASSAHHANSECFTWYPDPRVNAYSSYINLQAANYQKCIGNNAWENDNANPYFMDVNRHLIRVFSFRNGVNTELRAVADQMTREAARQISGLSYSSSSAGMNGPIRLVITGQPNASGMVQVRVEGFDLTISGQLKGVSSSLLTATTTISGQNLSLVGTYNIYTGSVALQNVSEQLNVHVRFGGVIGNTVKTIFGNWARSVARAMERDIHVAMSGKFTDINESLASRAFFSLDDAIPLGEFRNPATGVDLGLRLRDQISHVISHNGLVVEMSGTSFDDAYIFVQSGDVRLTLGSRLYPRRDDCYTWQCYYP